MSMGYQIAIPDVSSFLEPGNTESSTPGNTDTSTLYSPAIAARYERMIADHISLQQYLDQCGRDYVSYALQKYKNSYKAAAALGTSQASIMRRKQKFHL